MKLNGKGKEGESWTWEEHDIIDPMLSEEEISDKINQKLAYIIIELEHNLFFAFYPFLNNSTRRKKIRNKICYQIPNHKTQ